MPVKLCILLLIVGIVASQEFPKIPCPQYFRYLTNETSGEVYGEITLPPVKHDFDKGNFNISVEMCMVTRRPPAYAELDMYLISKFKQLTTGGRSTYHVYFPSQVSIPALIILKVLNDIVCEGKPPEIKPGESLVTMRGTMDINHIRIDRDVEAVVDPPSNPMKWNIEWIIRMLIGRFKLRWSIRIILFLPLLLSIAVVVVRYVWFILLCYGM